ncbi:hypothetical protein ACEWY4_026112 [Coilia grayii]|uniref:DUF7030 domain-containing protein n=1 Tax=Coilia grayii TaxID=363190 RepID=A0ABD1ITW7_9TELE
MAVEARPELVGKRFLCVSGEEPLELGEIGRWGWRAGVIRAVSHRDSDNAELTDSVVLLQLPATGSSSSSCVNNQPETAGLSRPLLLSNLD